MQYSVARTPQVGKSKLQITRDEKNHKWPKYDFAIIKSSENFHSSQPLIRKIHEIYLASVGK